MNREQLKHKTYHQYNKLKKSLNKIVPDFNADIIHQFRVAYKKFRAFLRMISPSDGNSRDVKIPGKLKKVYAILGSMRDLHLQQQRIKEATKEVQHQPQSYLYLLQEEIELLKTKLTEIQSKKPAREIRKKLDAFIPDEFTFADLKKYIQNERLAINTIIASAQYSDVNIHAVRKKLKDLFYNLKMYEEDNEDTSSSQLWNGKDEKYFNTLLDELGDFQDKSTAIALLTPGWLNSLETLDREQLEGIKKQLTREKDDFKKLIIRKLESDFGAKR